MSNIKWFVIVNTATGEPRSWASIDLDDPDTEIDVSSGLPYSKSGLKGISHPEVSARRSRYARTGRNALIEAIPDDERDTWIAEHGGPFEAVEIPFDPTQPPAGDKDGHFDVDRQVFLAGDKANCVKLVSGEGRRAKTLIGLREAAAKLEADMITRGESLPPGSR